MIRNMMTWLLVSLLLVTGLYPGDQSAYAEEAASISVPSVIRGFNHAVGLTKARQEYGANAMRLQLLPQNRVKYEGKTLEQAMEIELTNMEQILQEAAQEGVYIIIDLHQPITNNPDWDNGSPHLWADEYHLDRLIDYWLQIVERATPYRDYIYGYDLLNEPADITKLPARNAEWPEWAQAITDAIREIDETTPIIMELSPGAIPRAFLENAYIYAGSTPIYQGEVQLLDDDHVIYSVHMYEPHEYTHQGLDSFELAPTSTTWPDKTSYPGMIGNTHWDKNALRNALKPVRDFELKYNVPIYVGEFSAIRWAEGGAQYIQDCIEIFEEYGWDWTYHAYNESPVWSVEHTDLMTNSASQHLAQTEELTDRAAILKAYMTKNNYLSSTGKDNNLLKNANFELDTNADGLADYWVSEGPGLAEQSISLLSNTQVITIGDWGGINHDWVHVAPGEEYTFKADIKLTSGKLMATAYSVDEEWQYVAQNTLSYSDQLSVNDFQSISVDWTVPTSADQVSIRFWGDEINSSYALKNVQLIHKSTGIDLLSAGRFLTDTNEDGLADGWVEEGPTFVSKHIEVPSNTQTVTTSSWGGINHDWVDIAAGEMYTLHADIRLTSGKLMVIAYSVDGDWQYIAQDHLLYSDQMDTNGFRSISIDWIAPIHAERVSLRFWGDEINTAYDLKNVQLIHKSTGADLLSAGSFLSDTNEDGLADGWSEEGLALVSKSIIANGNIQTVSTNNWGGINQEWLDLVPGERYFLEANTKLVSGKLMINAYSIDQDWLFAGDQSLLYTDQLDSEFRTIGIDFTVPINAAKLSLRFWGDGSSTFALKNVKLTHLGPTDANRPPVTIVSPSSTTTKLLFDATPFGEKTITRTEYRIIGESGSWSTVPIGGISLDPLRTQIIVYRSIDSAGLVETARVYLSER